jgi:hypothetical protein
MDNLLGRIRGWIRETWHRASAAASDSAARADVGTMAHGRSRVLAVIAVILILYYPVGMLWYQSVDDDITLQPAPEFVVPGGSKTIATIATVVTREAKHWAPNKPFWHPAAALDNMPNFQLGVIYAVSRFAVELGDYLGRVRGSSSINPNLDQAAGLFKYDGRTWYWGRGNVIPTAKAESQYLEGVEALERYNRDVGAGRAVFDRRADNLIAFLDRVAADLGSASAILDARAKTATGYMDTVSDDVFYDVKGKMYGYYLIMRDLGDDFGAVLEQKNARPMWANMLESLQEGAEMRPLLVGNGRPDSSLIPSHVAALGFHVLRARTQIREIEDTLQK